MTRNDILTAVRNADLDYKKEICIEDICDIVSDLQDEFYIEWLVSSCWRWEWDYYLTYYEPKINSVILCTDVDYEKDFEDDEDLTDYIERMEEIVNQRKNFFNSLK